jgi:hypothetical protein
MYVTSLFEFKEFEKEPVVPYIREELLGSIQANEVQETILMVQPGKAELLD